MLRDIFKGLKRVCVTRIMLFYVYSVLISHNLVRLDPYTKYFSELSGAPKENIVQYHLNIALLTVV